MQNSAEETFYKTFSFVSGDKVLQNAPLSYMSLHSALSMRFRWNETNPIRQKFLASMAQDKQIAQIELIHSQKVFAIDTAEELTNAQGDGIITQNINLMPVITVADCMPIFLYEAKKHVFGVLHSGWRGTGIVKNAIELAGQKYGSKAEDFCVILGPHIHSCCYNIDEERAKYFREPRKTVFRSSLACPKSFFCF